MACGRRYGHVRRSGRGRRARSCACGRHEQGDPRTSFPRARRVSIPPQRTISIRRTVEQMIFETLLTYDYLARPAKLVPLTAEALPQITDNGQTYTFKLRKGIYFTPDPAFKGVKRELVADDYVYLVQAPDGPEDPLAVDVALRRQDRRPRRAGRRRRRRRAISTTTRRCRASRRSTATRCASG